MLKLLHNLLTLRIRHSIYVGCVALFLALCASPTQAISTDKPKPQPEVCINNICFSVEVANTPTTRTNGLMFRKKLAKNHGMLFVFPEEGDHVFWMKSTPLSLDIIWISTLQKIVHIEQNTTPFSLRHLRSVYPARYVLEIPAGIAQEHGFVVGMQVKIPTPL